MLFTRFSPHSIPPKRAVRASDPRLATGDGGGQPLFYARRFSGAIVDKQDKLLSANSAKPASSDNVRGQTDAHLQLTRSLPVTFTVFFSLAQNH